MTPEELYMKYTTKYPVGSIYKGENMRGKVIAHKPFYIIVQGKKYRECITYAEIYSNDFNKSFKN